VTHPVDWEPVFFSDNTNTFDHLLGTRSPRGFELGGRRAEAIDHLVFHRGANPRKSLVSKDSYAERRFATTPPGVTN
jgi:hypothetical protein